MNLLKIAALLLTLPACGQQLVQFAIDDAGGSGVDLDAHNSDGHNTDGHNTDAASRPMVIATNPTNAAINMSVEEQVTATFDRVMNGTTLTGLTFTVFQGVNQIAGTVSYTGSTATFVPNIALDISLVYTATITTGALDPQGASLASDYVWTFTTGPCSQARVDLLTAANYAVLAGSTVTSTSTVMNPTSVTGDLGVSPGSAVTGFPPGIIIGAQHDGDPTSAQAIADLASAYDDAQLRTLCAMTVSGDLGGLTLTPGLYNSTSSLLIQTADLTLDARGDADAVFIIQTASTLTTAPGRQVILTNNAKAANIYWAVGTSATIGTTNQFNGTIMAEQAITLMTGATLNGRALAWIAAVTLDTNTVVKP